MFSKFLCPWALILRYFYLLLSSLCINFMTPTKFITFLFVLQQLAWSIDGWRKEATKSLRIPAGRVPSPLAQTRVQFHQDQTQLLVVHETHIAIHKALGLESLKQVHHQTYSLI